MRLRRRVRRAVRPTLERVEERQLLSTFNIPSSTSAFSAAQTGGNGFGDASSPLLGEGTPTPREQARQSFRAVFTGRYYTSPGRFSDQSTTYFFRGIGGSSFFLHGDFSMGVVTPTDPTAPFTGSAILQDKNTNSQALTGLDLKGDRTAVDSKGRPTHLTLSADPNIYSGIFYVDAAAGTVDIHYGPNKSVTVVFNAQIYTSGLASPLVNSDLYARGNRPLKFRGPSAPQRP